MKLKSLKETPLGGWRFPVIEGEPPVKAESYRTLVQAVRRTLLNNNIPIPEDVDEQIQDWLCSQSPSDKCYYTAGLGDRASRIIHAVAKGVDAVTGGVMKVEKRTRGCAGCGKRRQAMNRRSS